MARPPRATRRGRSRRGPARLARITPAVAVAGLAAVSAFAFAAANAVTAARVDHEIQAISTQDLAPAACAGLGLNNRVVGGNGGGSNDLILGGAGNDTLNGGGGNDCILGGGGNDALDGQTGTDVCIGGPGTDTFPDPLPPLTLNGCETKTQ